MVDWQADLDYIANALGVLPDDLVPWLLREFRAGSVPDLPPGVGSVTATRLRRETHRVLQEVENGSRLIVTFHGRPIAFFLPVRQ